MSETRVVRVPVNAMTEAAFAPYGRLAGVPETPADRRVMTAMPFSCDGDATVSTIWQPAEGLAFTQLERHHGVTQTFFQLGGSPAVVCVAAPSEDADARPAPEDVRGFIIHPGQGFAFHVGTWHSLNRYVLNPPGATFVILNVEPNPTDIVDYATGREFFHANLDSDPAPRERALAGWTGPIRFEVAIGGVDG